MLFNQIFRNVINESMTAGGVAGVFGPAADGNSQFSSDFYAPGDSRNALPGLSLNIQRRPAFTKRKRSKKRRK